jgi:hypothetical protein
MILMRAAQKYLSCATERAHVQYYITVPLPIILELLVSVRGGLGRSKMLVNLPKTPY